MRGMAYKMDISRKSFGNTVHIPTPFKLVTPVEIKEEKPYQLAKRECATNRINSVVVETEIPLHSKKDSKELQVHSREALRFPLPEFSKHLQ